MAVTPTAPVAPATRDVDMMADVAEVNEQIGEVRERIARIEGALTAPRPAPATGQAVPGGR